MITCPEVLLQHSSDAESGLLGSYPVSINNRGISLAPRRSFQLQDEPRPGPDPVSTSGSGGRAELLVLRVRCRECRSGGSSDGFYGSGDSAETNKKKKDAEGDDATRRCFRFRFILNRPLELKARAQRVWCVHVRHVSFTFTAELRSVMDSPVRRVECDTIN